MLAVPGSKSSECQGASVRGCVFLPTFRDTDLLRENYGNRPAIGTAIDFHVYDDNFEGEAHDEIKRLCDENEWFYHATGRREHGDILADYSDLESWNRLCWASMTSLAENYDYVVKLDTDTLILASNWQEEIAGQLHGQIACAGTLEYHRPNQAAEFQKLAQRRGYSFELRESMRHLQGGLAAYSKGALLKLREMGFLEGPQPFAEDFYLSYACEILRVPFLETKTVGSWWHPYRPPLDHLVGLRAIHPLRRTEWESFLAGSCSSVV